MEQVIGLSVARMKARNSFLNLRRLKTGTKKSMLFLRREIHLKNLRTFCLLKNLENIFIMKLSGCISKSRVGGNWNVTSRAYQIANAK